MIFVYGLALVRIAGRRVFGKWSALDIIVSVVVGSNLSRGLTGGAAFDETLAATTLLMALHWVLAHAASRAGWFSSLVEGKSVRLTQNGVSKKAALLRESISQADLEEALCQSGVEHVTETRLIVL